MNAGTKGIGSTKHGKSGHCINCNHFTGTKGNKTKRKRNERSKRIHVNKYRKEA